MSTNLPAPEITSLNAPYWEALAGGRLVFQSCACGKRWLPPRDHCPACLSAAWQWTESRGRASLVSWVVYHVAYHESFADRLPYNVAVVELDEGPRLISNVIDCETADLHAGAKLELVVTEEHGIRRAQFRLLPDRPGSD